MHMEEMEMDELLASMWPEHEANQQFNVERPPARHEADLLDELTILDDPSIVDFNRLLDLSNYTHKGSSQLSYLVKSWEYRQANAVRLLREELHTLSQQRHQVELTKLQILEEEQSYGHHHPGPLSILDDQADLWPHPLPPLHKSIPPRPHHTPDSSDNWKLRAAHLEKLLEESHRREQLLTDKLHQDLQRQQSSPPLEELSQILKRADNFLHFVLQNAPVVIGHQDHELRYRFIYNHFPSLQEDDIIGKTDLEIFTGAGVKESQDFKREVLEKGVPAKREITFETELFGSKTFLIYVEPVFSKSGDTIGINYMGMDVTDQVRKREKMAKLRETIAVQKAKETELNKSIHITEETMRAKQMLATMSHEIRSPLSGVVSIAEILSTTKIDKEQRQLLDVMLSSGDLVLQLINDILDLSKVESGVMKLETTKFRPREVVKHVLQTAAASLQKILTLEGHVADDVPIEVIGDVLRIRQILTNLISNAVKFTHDGKVGIKLYTVPMPSWGLQSQQLDDVGQKEDKPSTETNCEHKGYHAKTNGSLHDENESTRTEHMEEQSHSPETTVWIRCDVYDTGIGIPDNALPTLFKRYMQVSADHARKYGGTGLGLAICKQLVELMGGRLTVYSREHFGSTFTFVLPYKLSNTCDSSDDADEISDMTNHDAQSDDAVESYFQFQPNTLGSGRIPKLLAHKITHKLSGLTQNSYSFPSSSDGREKETVLGDDACSVASVADTLSEPETSESHTVDHDNENEVCRGAQSQRHKNSQLQRFRLDTSHQEDLTREANVSPKISEAQSTGQRQEKISKAKTEAPNTSLGPKILLVEDNKINVMVTQSMMKQLGHNIDVVSNGIEAVRAIQRRSYSLVLMDVHMPLMNGLEATRLIRSFEETGSWEAAEKAGVKLKNGQSLARSTKRIPIIAMTANALSESGDECYENGMDSFVSKPVTFQKLKQCLEQHLSS